MEWFIVCCSWMESSNKQTNKWNMKLKSFEVVAFMIIYWHFAWFVENCHFIDLFVCFCLVFIVESILNVDFILQSNVFMIEFSKLAKSAISKQQQQRYQNKLKWLYARSKSNEEEKRDVKKRKRLKENERIEWKLNAIQMESI